ncbi:hypothetical protein KAR91_45280, partial [Candidatus Pacearchaeota archaeon]|nr:hypothetical protein [Candidatus Pacearchaeota archaeon]
MSKRTLKLLVLIIVGSLGLFACDPNGTIDQPEPEEPKEPPPASCTFISPALSAVVGVSGDVSGVTVPDGTVAEFDGGGYWCGSPTLEAIKIDVNAEIAANGCFNDFATPTPASPNCEPFNALAAIDIRPSNIGFINIPKPELRYDLAANPPVCRQEGIVCGGFGIYQLLSSSSSGGPSNWLLVGQATETSYAGTSVAVGTVNHFSIFALVELPEPDPAPSPSRFEMIVASDFLDDGLGTIKVTFTIVQADVEGFEKTRLFSFTNIDPALDEGSLPGECFDTDILAETLTCLFPIGTSVLL